MTPRIICLCVWTSLVSGAGCSSPHAAEPLSQSTSTSTSTPPTTSTPSSTPSTSSTPSPTEPSVHDSAVRSTPTRDTGRTDTGWFTLPGPGFDSANPADFLDSQDTG